MEANLQQWQESGPFCHSFTLSDVPRRTKQRPEKVELLPKQILKEKKITTVKFVYPLHAKAKAKMKLSATFSIYAAPLVLLEYFDAATAERVEATC